MVKVSGSNKIYKLEAKKSRRRETPTLSACADSSTLFIFAIFVTFLALFGTFCLKESCITCHESHVTFHLSHVTFHLLLTPTFYILSVFYYPHGKQFTVQIYAKYGYQMQNKMSSVMPWSTCTLVIAGSVVG